MPIYSKDGKNSVAKQIQINKGAGSGGIYGGSSKTSVQTSGANAITTIAPGVANPDTRVLTFEGDVTGTQNGQTTTVNFVAKEGPQGPSGDDARVRLYSDTDTYPIRELVVDDITGKIAYISQVDDNLGNPLTDTDFWVALEATADIQTDSTIKKVGSVYSVNTDEIADVGFVESQNAYAGLSTDLIFDSIAESYDGTDNDTPFTIANGPAPDDTDELVVSSSISGGTRRIIVRTQDLNDLGKINRYDLVTFNTTDNDAVIYKVLDFVRTSTLTEIFVAQTPLNGDTPSNYIENLPIGTKLNVGINSATPIALNELRKAEADLDVNNQKIINVAAPDSDSDATNKDYVDTQGAKARAYATTVLDGNVENVNPNATEVSIGGFVPSLNARFVNFGDTTIDLTDATNYQVTRGNEIGYYILQSVADDQDRNSGYLTFITGVDVLASVTNGQTILFKSDEVLAPNVYHPFTGASATEDGHVGLVPQPKAGDEAKALLGDGTFGETGATYTAGNGLQLNDTEFAINEAITATTDYVDNAISNANKALSTTTPDTIAYTEDTDEFRFVQVSNASNAAFSLPQGLQEGRDDYPFVPALSDVTITQSVTPDRWTTFQGIGVVNGNNSIGLKWNGNNANTVIDTAHSMSFNIAYTNNHATQTLDASNFIFHLTARVADSDSTDWTKNSANVYNNTHEVPGRIIEPQGDAENYIFTIDFAKIEDSDFHTAISNGQVLGWFIYIENPFQWNILAGQTVRITPAPSVASDTLRIGAHHFQIDGSLKVDMAADLLHADSDDTVTKIFDNATKMVPRAVRDQYVNNWALNGSYTLHETVVHTSKLWRAVVTNTGTLENQPSAANTSTWLDLTGAGGSDYMADNYTGTFPTATGEESVSIGQGATADGDDGIAIGRDTTAAGDLSTAIGEGSDAMGLQSLAIGDTAVATQTKSIAIGPGVAVTSEGGLGIGEGATVDHLNAIGLGVDATTTTANQLVIGSASSITTIRTPGITGGSGQFIAVDSDGNWTTDVPAGEGGATEAYVDARNPFDGIDGIEFASMHNEYNGLDKQFPFTLRTTGIIEQADNEVHLNKNVGSGVWRLTFLDTNLTVAALTPYFGLVTVSSTGSNNTAFKVIDISKGPDGTTTNVFINDQALNGVTNILDSLADNTAINVTANASDPVPLNEVPTPTGDVSLGTHRITNLGTPTANADASTKEYTDDNQPSFNGRLRREAYRQDLGYNTNGDLIRVRFTKSGKTTITQGLIYSTDGDLDSIYWWDTEIADANITPEGVLELPQIVARFFRETLTYTTDGDLNTILYNTGPAEIPDI